MTGVQGLSSLRSFEMTFKYKIWDSLQIFVVFSNWTKNVDQFAVGEGGAAVPGVGGDDCEYAGFKYLGNIVYDHFKFPFDGKGALLVHMAVPGYGGTFSNLDKVDGVVICVN
jgi:hypothetical protein